MSNIFGRRKPITTKDLAKRNREVVDLQAQGRIPEALAAAEEAQQLAVAHLPETDLERAKAIHNLAAIQSSAGEVKKALLSYVQALEAMRAAVGEEHEYYGHVQGTFASFLASIGEFEEAELFYVRSISTIRRRLKGNENRLAGVVRGLVEMHEAMSRQEQAQADEDAHAGLSAQVGEAHFERSRQIQWLRMELERMPPAVREFYEKDMDKARKDFGARSTYGQALAIVDRRRESGEPYALFLRGFEGEDYDYRVNSPMHLTDDPELHTNVTVSRQPSVVEIHLGKALQGKMPALAVASPSSIDPGQTSMGALLPRLILPNEGWLDIVQVLIGYAHLIVVDCLGLNPGLRKELEAIAEGGKADNTVIVLHKDRADLDELTDWARLMANTTGGTLAADPSREWVTKDHELLRPFKRIGYVEDVSKEDLASSDLFAELLAFAPLVRSATRLGKAGTEIVETGSGTPIDVVRYLETSLFLAQGVPGWRERGTAYFNLGLILQGLGNIEGALEAFTACHTAGVALNDLSNQGRGLAMKALVLHKAGQSSEAAETSLASLEPLEKTGDGEYLERSLRTLSEANQALGEGEKAEAANAELQRLKAEGQWSRSRAEGHFMALFFPN